jgi:hypothetical protein
MSQVTLLASGTLNGHDQLIIELVEAAIARFELRLHLHVAGRCGPDERVSLRDVRMGGELRRYIGFPAKDFRHPFANGVLGAGEPTPSLGNKPDAT